MPLLYLTLLAVASMATLAVTRVVRVRSGRSPLPDLPFRRLFVIAFLVGPPIVFGPLTANGGLSSGVGSVPVYLLMLGALGSLMAGAAAVVPHVAPEWSRPVLMLALIGANGDPDDDRFDPPMSPRLAESAAIVEQANAAFPRGPEFPTQIERPGFRVAWDALDAATVTLEGRIADDRRLGVAVASRATSLALDARSRLQTLRRLATFDGQAWAA